MKQNECPDSDWCVGAFAYGKRRKQAIDGCKKTKEYNCYFLEEPTMSTHWDEYFHDITKTIATNSKCLSRKIGAVLVKDNTIIATGYNGPPRGIPHCGDERIRASKADDLMMVNIRKEETRIRETYRPSKMIRTCPRQLAGFPSGAGLHTCIAAHAERNCLISAARFGTATNGASMYMNCIAPCKECIIELINAGIREIVVEDLTHYDEVGEWIYKQSDLIIRKFGHLED